jgi:glutamate/tyrosine decarboxylase-like PLP-dependent enzyme
MASSAEEILDRLRALRQADAPTHGGRVLSYVYDSGRQDLDELAADAARLMQPVNGLDPTTFTSVAVLERDVVAFARELLGGSSGGSSGGGSAGDGSVVGSVTSGGTESCLLAVKTARDLWRAANGTEGRPPRLVAPTTVHAAFQKAAHLFDLTLDLVPVDQTTGTCDPSDIIERIGADVALVVVSAPSYPFAALDPIAAVAEACAERGVSCHVDACIGGWILPFWRAADGGRLPAWDLRVPGVTSLSADLHKYGYAPKGVSVLLYRGRDRHRAQFFATTRWPGYPVVNPTMLGSKSAGPLAAAWAIINELGMTGFAELADACAAATQRLIATVDGIEGLRIVGSPVGPLIAVAADDGADQGRRVDPHHLADHARSLGWILQQQPGLLQQDGSRLPHTTHLTITPVTLAHIDELCNALTASADAVRGVAAITGQDVANAVPAELLGALADPSAPAPDSASSNELLHSIGLLGNSDTGSLPDRMAPFLALIEAPPHPLTERLLIELLARVVEPTDQESSVRG